MYDVLLLQKSQGRQQLDGKSPDETQRNPLEVVVLNELVEIYAEQLEGDAQVVPEIEVVHHVHHIRGALDVALAQVLEDLHLDQRLVVKSFLVPDDLASHLSIRFVVESSDHLAKGSFTERAHDLVPIENVVVQHYEVIAALIVIGMVVDCSRSAANLRRSRAKEPDLWKIQDLPLLVLCELVHVVLQHLRRCHGQLSLLLRLLLLLVAAIAALRVAWLARTTYVATLASLATRHLRLLHRPLCALGGGPRRQGSSGRRDRILQHAGALAARRPDLPCCLRA
mmetsp:Transcript_55745/g.180990  ORF Transcript_55745/g.180990 Transcript_55745/m.180990 type:complete len:282 (-) Transcript_55745:420-1265(-)